jgi:hypothetical protein
MPLPWPRFSRRDAVFATDSGPFYGREAIEKFRVGLFKELHFSHHLIKTDPNSPRVRHVEVSLGTAREVNLVFCGREEGAKARMVINNTRPEYGLHHGHNIVLVTVSEVSAEKQAMTSTDGVAQTDAINVIASLALQPYKQRPRRQVPCCP